MSPRVSVVIPAYNAGRYIRQALESVFAQSLQDVEVIVVNDGSTDDTAEILQSVTDDRLSVLHQKNRGVSAARNAGLAKARAPYTFFLDADDMLAQDALGKMALALDRMPERVACFGHHIKITEDGVELSKRSYLPWKMLPDADTLRHLIAKNFICGAICVRTEAARVTGGFNPALKLGEDWDFWCRLALLGDFAAMPDDVVLYYRQRFDSANYRLRSSPLRPDYRALDAIYSNTAIRERFSPAELRNKRRLAEIDAFWAGARNEYVQNRTLGFLQYLLVGALRYPDSILRPRLVYLFLRGLRLPSYTRAARAAREQTFVVDQQPAGKQLFLLPTPSREACAIEIFGQKMASALQARYPRHGYETLPVSGRWSELPGIFRRVADADGIVFSLPLVAWKRVLLAPLAILLFATVARRPVHVFMHEWKGLHWLRRLALAPFVWLSRTIIVVSPFIADQIAGDPWLRGAGAKCRLVPHPPTICRPQDQQVTERIIRVRQAAERADVVIGYFGSIYRGKAATALLDVCKYLNDRGVRPLIVFIGSFTKSLDDYEQEFWSKVALLGIENQVIITGYVPSETELYTLFEEIGAFLFLFPEGLTARRSSVIACLQSDRPVVVTAPHSDSEFAHHDGFRALIEAGALIFVPHDADLRTIADHLLAAATQGTRRAPVIDAPAWWNTAAAATDDAIQQNADGTEAPAGRWVPAE